jgi:uncharacterized protein Yka (UPF0111/DUF47 family)
MLILIIIVCSCANLLMTFFVGSMVNRLTFNKNYLETIEELEKGKRYKEFVEEYKKYIDKLPTGCDSLKFYQLLRKYFLNIETEDRPIKPGRMDYMEKGAHFGKPREEKK